MALSISTIVTAVLVAFLAVWFVLSVLNQYGSGRLIPWAHRFDPASLIPIWTFFAPRPGTTDYGLLYRDVNADGSVTPWRQLDAADAGVLRGIWHPSKRRSKLVTDVVSIFGRSYDPKKTSHLIDIPYLVMLSMVERAEHDFRATHTQFVVVGVDGMHREPNGGLVFASEAIPLREPAMELAA